MSDVTNSTERSTVKRLPARGVYDRAVIHQILDAGMVCHLGFVVEGQPFVIPTTYVRVDETVYVHGSPASRMLQTLERGVAACLTVTLVDGLVLARSAFHHSINYRSVVVFGTAVLVSDPQEKLASAQGAHGPFDSGTLAGDPAAEFAGAEANARAGDSDRRSICQDPRRAADGR